MQQVRRTWRIFPKAVFPQTAKLGEFQAKGTCVFMKGLEQRRILHRIGGKVNQSLSFSWLKSQESEKVNIIIP